MKKNWLLIIFSLIIYLGLGFGISIYLVIPGINKLKEANNIKELTYEEKAKIIDNINQKYLTLETETVNKYTPDINNVNQKYDTSKNSIIKKYDNLKNSITKKYDNLEKQIKEDIIEVNLEKNKEFRNNGLTKKFYELSDKWMDLNEQEMQLDSNERKELNSNEANKKNELNSNETNRKNELTTIEKSKSNELDRLSIEKDKEINKINNQNTNKNSIRSIGILKIVIGIFILIIPLLYIISIFNKLTHLSNSVKEKWSQIEVLLKQRADLIPNVVETIKGASTHEKSTLTNVTKARNQFLKASTKEEEMAASKKLSTAINGIFILKETYPELKTNRNFMDLQDNLEEIENNIALTRQIYNKAVLKYKNKLEMFPSNIIANIFNFEPELFFEADEEDKENPNINFK